MTGDPIRDWADRRRPAGYRLPDPPTVDRAAPVDPATLTPGTGRPDDHSPARLFRDFLTGLCYRPDEYDI